MHKNTEYYPKLTLALCTGTTLAAFLFCFLYGTGFTFPIAYGEGPILDQALRILRGINIYQKDIQVAPYTISNYPPLYPLVLSLIFRFSEISFDTGRYISLISTVGCTIMIYLIVLRLTARKISASFGAMVFLSTPLILKLSTQGRIDMLALFLYASGVLFSLSSERRFSWLLASLSMSAAVYTRQSYLAPALFMPAVLFLKRDSLQSAIKYALCFFLILLSAFIILEWQSHGGFYFHVITSNINTFQPQQLRVLTHTTLYLLPASILLAVLSIFSFARIRFYTMAFLLAAVPSFLSAAKIGADWNYLTEMVFALSVITGLVLAQLTSRRFLLGISLIALQIFTTVLQADKAQFYRSPIVFWQQQKLTILELQELLAKESAQSLHDNLQGIELMSGRPIYFQPFIMTQLSKQGMWNQESFLKEIHDKSFSAISILGYHETTPRDERWTEQMLSAIHQGYSTCFYIGDITVLIPQSSQMTELKKRYCPKVS